MILQTIDDKELDDKKNTRSNFLSQFFIISSAAIASNYLEVSDTIQCTLNFFQEF